jgi:type VI secretion system secreted protein VgrG
MNLKALALLGAVLCSPFAFVPTASAQGTAFTYQGRLNASAAPATGNYDFTFALYNNSATNTGQVGNAWTNLGVGVTNGLFTVTLDFGANFTGASRWLSIGVRTNGGTNFTALSPLTPLTPTPYAIYTPNAGIAVLASNASSVAATNITGTIQTAQINDGGSAAYQAFQQIAQTVGGDTSVSFSNIFQVTATNGTTSFSLTVNGSALGTVLGFSGTEAMSQPYSYVVETQTSSAVSNPDGELGLPATLTFTRGGRSTAFSGLVTACTLASSTSSSYLYTVKIESSLAYMALGTDYRIYQNTTVPSVASSAYQRDTSNSAPATNLTASYQTHASLTQYGETELNFFNRILENEGIFYFFNQSASPPSLMIGDNTAAYLASPNSPFTYYGNNASNITAGAEYIRTFQKAAHQSTLTSLVDSLGDTPQAVSGTEGVGSYFEFGNAVEATAYDQQLAQARQDLQTAQRSMLAGTGNVPDLRAGYTFGVTDSSGAGLGGSYLVTSIHQAGFVRVTNGVNTYFYGSEFTAIPSSLTFRPPLLTPKPHAEPTVATVTGPAGEEIYVDLYARVKVLFSWDRHGTNDNTSSEWVQVASPWAGAGFRGMIFNPRIGDEVVVSFIQGDPDQPVVSGSLYSASAFPPFSLPSNKTQSGITTRSSLGGGGMNVFRFEDKKGSEDIYIHAQKDFDISVVNNLYESISGSATENVAGNKTVTVGNQISLTAGTQISLNGPVSTTGSATIAGPLTVTAGTQSINGAVGIDTASPVEGSLTVNTNIYLVDHPIYLRGSTGLDHNHGLAYCGTGVTNFSPSVLPDGPVLWGFAGGALGVVSGGQHAILSWTNNGVAVSGNFSATLAEQGGFGQAVADIENTDTTANCSPALRVNAHGSPAYGALSVSTGGPVSATNTNPIATFGNNTRFVSYLDNNGNWYANGSYTGSSFFTLSDRAAKENFTEISPKEVLDKVAALPLSRWNYKEDKGSAHIGPMAQDFRAAFNLGRDDKHIATVDEEGVALAAIQGLNQKLGEKEAEIAALKQKNDSLETRLDKLEALIKTLGAAGQGQIAP